MAWRGWVGLVFVFSVGCGPGGGDEPPPARSDSSGVADEGGSSGDDSTDGGEAASDSSTGQPHETDCEGAVMCEEDWQAGEIEGGSCAVYAIQHDLEVRFTVLDPDDPARGEHIFVDPVLELAWRSPFDATGPTGVVLQCTTVRQAEFRTCLWVDCLDPYSWWLECEEIDTPPCP